MQSQEGGEVLAISHVDVGDFWQPTWTFEVGTTPTDPTTLVVKHRFEGQDGVLRAATTITENNPASLTASSQPISRTAAGVYRLNLLVAEPGYYWAKADATGAVVASEQHEAVTDPDAFTASFGLSSRALVGLGETKDWLQFNRIDTDDDLEIVRVVNDLSDRFYDESQREFKVWGSNPQTRTFDVDATALRYGRLFVGDLTSFTQVQMLDTDWVTVLETLDLEDVQGLPINRKPWEPIRYLQLNTGEISQPLRAGFRVKVAGTWGFPSVPGNVRQAVLDAVAETLDRDVEHWRQDLGATQTGEGGNVVMVGISQQRVVSLPPRSLAVAWSYRDPVVG
jgi:hypothetical protein